jgi:outer membrane protein assembly factor BamB
MSIIISAVMVVSISVSLAKNVGELSSNGTPGLPLSIISSPIPQTGGQPSSSLSGSGGLADSPWPMFRQNLNHTGFSPYDTSGNNGQLKWSFSADWDMHSSPTIGPDGTIYVGSHDYKLYAINPDGTEKWTFVTGYIIHWSSPAISSDGTIYIGSRDNKLYAINPDGTEKWSYTTGEQIFSSSPAIGSDGTIYIGSDDDNLYAIDPNGSKKWNFITGSDVRSSPAISSDGTIYIGSYDHKLYAIKPDGTEKWNFTTGGEVRSSPTIGSDGTIYIGSNDNKLYAINPDGTEKWNFTTGSKVYSSPAIGSDETIYMGSQDKKVYAINPDGTEKWSFTTGYYVWSSPAIGSEGTIYIGSHDDNLYALNPDGTEKWCYTTYGGVECSPAIGSDGTIYIGSHKAGSSPCFFAIGMSTQNLNMDVTSHFSELNSAAQSLITVHVTDGTNPVQGATVNLDSDNGGMFSPQSGITDTNGDFKSIFTAPTVTSQIICRISAQASKNGYNNGSEYVDVTINPIPWPMFRHNLNHTGLSPYDTSSNNGKLKWSFLTGARVVSSPAIGSDGTIFVGSFDNKLYAINSDGTDKWYFTTGSEVFSSPTIDSYGTIYVGSHDNRLYAINPNGTEKWNFSTGHMVYSSPTIGSDGTIYIGSHDHKLYAINPDGTLKWNFVTGQSVRSMPTIGFDGTIYVSSYDYKIYAINPDGSEKWNFVTGGKVASSPAISSDGTIYVGSQDEKLYAINHEGIEKWNFTTSGWVWASPAIGSDGTIYIGSYDDKIYAINEDGSEKWNFTTDENIHSSPAIGSDGTIYSGSDDGILYAINPDGSLKWNFTTEGIVFSSPAIDVDSTIYVGSYDNKLYAIDGRSQPPIAIAGPDQTVNECKVVYFDGTGSRSGGEDGGWVARKNIPEPGLGDSAVLDNEIYFLGGGGPPSTPVRFWKYNPTTDSWSRLPDLDAFIADFSVAAANGKIYAIGGHGCMFTSDAVYEFDPITNNWSFKSSMPIAMEDFGVAVVDDIIYVIGGRSDFLNSTVCANVFAYDPIADDWSVKADMPTPRADLAATVLDGKIYAIGGSWPGSTGPLEVYDPSKDAWTRKANMSSYRVSLSADSLGGDIYAFGGSIVPFQATNMTEMYDPVCDAWVIKSTMLDSRMNFGSGVIGNRIFAVGGYKGSKTGYPNITEMYWLGGSLSYAWDFNSYIDTDGDGNFTNDIDATGPTPTHVYGDDGKFIVTLRVTDNNNLSATDTCNVTVQNVDPTVTIESLVMELEVGLRVAGRKYNNVSMTLYEEGNPIGYVSIERMPGSPNEQMAWIPVSINFSKSYSATVTYTPEDPPNVGANPVWIYIKSKNGSMNKIHHTFNVQQSKKRDSDHWNHVEPWEVDLNGHFIGLPFEIISHIIDPGSDDEILTFTYGSQVKTVKYLNNPLNPDPYPSPEVNPVDILDTTTLVYEGLGTVTLVVKDDDNIRLGIGEGYNTFSIG